MPSIVFTTSIRPASTAKSARSPPSGTANSPGARCTSADVRARRSSSPAGSPEKSGTAATSSTVSIAGFLRPGRGRLERVPGVAPRLHAAVERDRADVAHRAQRVGGEGRYLPELAARDDAHGGIGQHLIDAQLELAARHVA